MAKTNPTKCTFRGCKHAPAYRFHMRRFDGTEYAAPLFCEAHKPGQKHDARLPVCPLVTLEKL